MNIDNSIKDKVKAECIFLTHNEKMHKNNNKEIQDILWRPDIQETKVSEYGNINIRYKYKLKHKYINDFLNVHEHNLPWQKVRYIF
jgi:spore photoproduct lyase